MSHTAATDTRDAVYHKYKNLTFIGKRKEVHAFLTQWGPMTSTEISKKIGWPINCVTRPILELRQMGYVVDNGKRTCRITNENVHEWRATQPAFASNF